MRQRHTGWSKGYPLGAQLTSIAPLSRGGSGSRFSRSEFRRNDHSEMPAWTARCGFGEAHRRAAFSFRILCSAAAQASLWRQKCLVPAGHVQRREQSRYRRGAPSRRPSSAPSSWRFRSKEQLGGDTVPSGQRRPFQPSADTLLRLARNRHSFLWLAVNVNGHTKVATQPRRHGLQRSGQSGRI
jgi:hypothetical protein